MSIKSHIWYFVKYISSLRFAIGLLLILAFASTLGTLIEQDQSLDYYKFNYSENRPLFFFITWRQIIYLGLNHAYSTYWFFTILILFFLSLLLCTFSTQLPVLKNARRWSFLHSQASLEKKGCYSQSGHTSLLNCAYILNFKSYYVFHKGYAIYAYKGLIGRIAPIFVHFSIVFTLVGSVLGFTNGFIAQEMVPTGEVFHVQNFVKSGYFGSTSRNVIGKVDDFFIVFNSDQSIQQFFSDISLISNDGHVHLKKSISVNRPLKFKGITFYQTDWRVSALRLKIGSSNLLAKPLLRNTGQLPGVPFWSCDLSLDNNHRLLIVIPNLSDNLLIYNDQGELIKVTQYGLWTVVYGIPLVFKDIMSSTGLQVKADPGIILAYAGFLILICSILMSYASYSQIWASKNNKRFHLSGNTNRALLMFENEISAVYKKYVYLSLSN